MEDLEAKKVRRFVRFGGAVFHDITPQLRRILFLEADGVYLPHAAAGSSFSRVGLQERNGNSKVVILDINGKQIRDLDNFIEACKTITDGQHTYVVVRDFNLFDSSPTPKSLTINLKFGPLQQFEWNQEALDWEEIFLIIRKAFNQAIGLLTVCCVRVACAVVAGCCLPKIGSKPT